MLPAWPPFLERLRFVAACQLISRHTASPRDVSRKNSETKEAVMAGISAAQQHQEDLEVALWDAPSPRPEASARYEVAAVDADGNDQAVGNKAAGDGSSLPDLGPLSAFGTWESVASTIMHRAVAISDFNPESEVFDPVSWNNYLQKFSTMPFFLSYTSDQRDANISSLSLEKGVNAVDDLLKNILAPAAWEGVLTSIQKIGQLALESEGKTQKQSNQQTGVLSRRSSRLYLGVVRTMVEMKYKSGKGYEQLEQTIVVRRGYGELDFEKCKRSASKILEWDSKNVDEWEKGTGSYHKPPNNSPAWGK
ncbi:hypothetical protein ACMA1D_09105 [Streptomyces sp. 796.1]|uniref:hypothetical protein n=1 Tax=Streptomyces sp. 796.1 TaxID=3163029 RepID=UPI0039C96707